MILNNVDKALDALPDTDLDTISVEGDTLFVTGVIGDTALLRQVTQLIHDEHSVTIHEMIDVAARANRLLAIRLRRQKADAERRARAAEGSKQALLKERGDFITREELTFGVYNDHASWSRETFGDDTERGPLGALRHLQKEAGEALAVPDDISEYADCQLLVWDAARRAGLGLMDLLAACRRKMEVNRRRTYLRTPDGVPSEHVKGDAP